MKILKRLFVILFFVVAFALVLGNLLPKPVENLDELWNYNIARQIAYGLLPYKDISMITTPLMPAICSICIKLIADELIVARVLTAALATAIFIMSYLIMKKLTKKTSVSLLATMVIAFVYYPFITYDYNYGALLAFLIAEYLIVRKFSQSGFKHQIFYNLLIGFVCGLSILTKQTMGLIITFFIMLVPFIKVTKKEDWKIAITNILWRILGTVIPIGAFLIYLSLTNSLNDFISYCILGVKHFSNSISYLKLFANENILTRVWAGLAPVILLAVIIIAIIKRKKDTNFVVMAWLSIPMLFAMYPIADDAHFYVAIMPLLLTGLYLLADIDIMKAGKLENAIIVAVTVFAACMMGYISYKEYSEYISIKNKNTELEHYHYLQVDNYIKNRANELEEYRKNANVEVYILNADVAAYHIPMNRYYKDYDMFNLGNLGKDGESGIIKRIEESHNCIYLVLNEKFVPNWQTPITVTKYIREKLQYKEDVNIYQAYYKE